MATSASQDGEYGSSHLSPVVRPVLTVVRASDLPRLKATFEESEFYVTATDGVRTGRTSAVRSREWSVRWDETLSGFQVSPTTRLVVHVVARRRLLKDIPIGLLVIPFESLRPFSLREFNLPVSSAFQRPILVLSISLQDALPHEVTPIAGPHEVSAGSNQVSDVPPGATPGGLPDDSLAEGRTRAAENLSSADEAIFNVKAASFSLAKSIEAADDAPDDLQKIAEFYDTWSLVLKNVKWVVDAVDKIAEVHPWAKMAW
ncbi:hypothetical protein BC834DRAFT_1035517, partial [Gloeopeniophorella convolvens]